MTKSDNSSMIFRVVFGVALALILILIFSPRLFGNKSKDTKPSVEEPENSLKPVVKERLSFHSVELETTNPVSELTEIVGTENMPATLSLNRLDDKHLKTGQTIIIPSSFDNPWSLSAFPKVVPNLVDVPKIIFVSQKVQEFGAYEYGQLVRFGGVSTGKESTKTPSKLYFTNWKGKSVISTVDDSWIMPWYFNIENLEGVSMHQYDLPGYPASHSCVRMAEEDAKWFYNWADQWTLSSNGQEVLTKGTPVLLFDEYDYDSKGPWKMLAEDSDAIDISLDYLNSKIDPLLGEIKSN